MTLSPHLVTAIAIIAPGLVFIVYGRVRAHRHRGALVAEDQPIRGKRGRAGLENQANILFERKAEPVPSFLLRRFTVPQRTYLRQQYAPAITGYMLCAYLIFVAVSVGLLSRNPSYAAANVALRIWSSYVDVLTGAGYLSVIAALLTAMTVVAYLKTPSSAVFMRTRPLSHRFLFWGRTSFALAGILAATLTTILASMLLLFFIYGPVWKLAVGWLASIVRLSLSLLTTTALVFSIFVALSCLSRRTPAKGSRAFLPALLGGIFCTLAIRAPRFAFTSTIPRMFFLFPTQASPQPLAFALVPMLCVVMLLLLAQRLSTRFEI
jgi:hypothetical protein